MNLLKRIKIENVKGKSEFDLEFADLVANKPNIIVAPNGYGKSTLTAAFKAASSGRMKLDERDIYERNTENHPKLEIELCGENSGIYVSSDEVGDISRNIFIYTIGSPLYAKSTSKGFGGRTVSTADMRVEQIVLYDSIPPKKTFHYSHKDLVSEYGSKAKLFQKVSSLLEDVYNVERLVSIKNVIKKCWYQKGSRNLLTEFVDDCSDTGTCFQIKQSVTEDRVEILRQNSNIRELLNCVSCLRGKPQEWLPIDDIFCAIQICKLFSLFIEAGEADILNKVYAYLSYKDTRESVDERLNYFNTTGRNIRTQEDHGKLVINFERAASMSNGERDILTFISHLTKVEKEYKKQIGILVIDEVFDYLDGSNMLAVQFYLAELIKKCKDKGKVLFPIILTHLDPAVFTNYYFKSKKVHYISANGTIDLNSDIVKLLRLRENKQIDASEKGEIEKYYLHFIEEEHFFSPELSMKISNLFCSSNLSFRDAIYFEISNRYLQEQTYNPVSVLIGIRIKIEELVYNELPLENKAEYLLIHKVSNKLIFAEEKGIDVAELFYLLQPLYNDGAHLGGSDDDVKRKIKSCYLKTENIHIRRMVNMLFSNY